MIILIDNYDSFTYNLYQYIGEIDNNIEVYRNDMISSAKIKELNPTHIVISPGPGHPADAGNCLEIIKDNHKVVPILGICLGHQAIGMSFGGNIIQSKSIVHGKVSTINIYPSKIFNNTDKQIRVVRYHSLVIDNLNFPPSLTVTADLENGTIMGLEHVKYPIFGIQFHPESIDTQFGKKIIKNFLEL